MTMQRARLGDTGLAIILAGGLSLSSSAAAAIEGTNWFPIGPAPIVGFFPGGVTGRASTVAVNPANPDDVWVGTASGGVWHSTDGGKNWTPKSDNEAALAIGALELDACDASKCNVIYAGTGENAIRRDTYHGQGLLIGGISTGEFAPFWTLRQGDPFDFSLGSIIRIVLDRTTSGAAQRLYVALSSGETASATESTVTAPEPSSGYGLYKSENRGAAWTKLTVAGTGGVRPTDLEMMPGPGNSLVLYAGFLGKGVFKTTDGGANWCPLNPGAPLPAGCSAATGLPDPASTTFDWVEIAISPSAPSTVYAMLGDCPHPILNACVPMIFRSTNGGATWEPRLAGDPTLSLSASCPYAYSRYTHALTVHPTTPNTLFLGGGSLCKSTDGGQTFAASDANTAGGPTQFSEIVHLDHHAVVIHPADPNRMYDASDGGFAYSTDGGTTWKPGNDDLQITGFQSIASSPLTGRIIGGTQDNGGPMWSGGRAWTETRCCGDGGATIMDRSDVMRMYATTWGDVSVPVRSTDGGASWRGASNGLPFSDPRAFYPPMVQDPSPPRPLYFGTNRLFESTNGGDAWMPVSSVLSSAGPFPDIGSRAIDAAGSPDVVTAIGVAPSNANRIYLGYYSGKIFVTGGACANASCWPERDGGLPGVVVTRIAVHPTSADTAYATFSGFGAYAHVWKTTDAGTSWSPVASGIPTGLPVNTISIEPSSPSILWLGTDQGVFKSTDGGANWAPFNGDPFNPSMPNVPVYEISIDETHGRVYAATHGRGAFVLTKPFLSNYEGWVDGGIWDIPVYGHAFLPNSTCTMRILRQDGSECASGTTDAMGATIGTDGAGQLVTSNGGFYIDQPVAWACFNGKCLGGTDISACNQPGNPVSTVIATCGGLLAVDRILGCPALTNPPSSLMGLSGLPGGPPVAVAVGQAGVPAVVDGSFDVVASLQAMEFTRTLCGVNVPFHAGETQEDIIVRASDALNASASCAASGVSATVEGSMADEGEDVFGRAPQLRIAAPGVQGGQLITAVRAAPGQTTGLCFELNGLGVPVVNQIQIMMLRLQTAGGGAAGGDMTVIEESTLGTCSITVPTVGGQSAAAIADAFEAAFQAPGIPGPNPDCPAEHNPRDIVAAGESLISVLASRLVVCSMDAGVGFFLEPDGLTKSRCIGADADADGYCDDWETAVGCDPNDAAVIPTQPLTGLGFRLANGLLTYAAPTSRRVLMATDPSCAAVGTCGPTGFCTAGKIADPCATDADCDQPPNTCRVVVNYAAVPDLTLVSVLFNRRTPVAGFMPVALGCARKVDVTPNPTRVLNFLNLRATGTLEGRPRRELDSFRYRRPRR